MKRPSCAGLPYRPSNGTEGACEIVAASWLYTVDDPRYPYQWCYDDFGVPCCTEFLREEQ